MKKRDALKAVLKDAERKPLYKMGIELIQVSLLEKEVPMHYFTSYLYKKDSPNPKDFVANRKIGNIHNNHYEEIGKGAKELENKFVFWKVLSEKDVSTPNVLGHTKSGNIHILDPIVNNVGSKEMNATDKINYLIEKSINKTIFIKPIDGMGGKKSFKFSYNQNNDIEKFTRYVKNNDFIIQDTISQNEKINEIYASSLNTVRVHTLKNKTTNDIEIASAFMRLGAGGSIIDNGSSGGLYVPVNIKDWTLGNKGYSNFKKVGKTFENHPDTKFEFNGFKIPHSDLILTEIEKASKLFDTEFIGWDVAITEQGVTIIEGNHNPDMFMAQIACGGLRNNEIFSEVFKELI